MIQIGMKCEPLWLCNVLELVLAALAIAVIVFVIRAALREYKKNKGRRRK